MPTTNTTSDVVLLSVTHKAFALQARARMVDDNPVKAFNDAADLKPSDAYTTTHNFVIEVMGFYRMFLEICRHSLKQYVLGPDRFIHPMTRDIRVAETAVTEFLASMIHQTFQAPELQQHRKGMLDLHRTLSPEPEHVDEAIRRMESAKNNSEYNIIVAMLRDGLSCREDLPAEIALAEILMSVSIDFLQKVMPGLIEVSKDDLRALIDCDATGADFA